MAQTRNLAPAPDNQAKTPWYRMEASTTDEDLTEVMIYDSIGGWWAVDAAEFVKELNAIKTGKIALRVNSPGGDVYDALAIMNALHRHKAHVTATVDGLAASAASFIIQAADEIQMSKGAEIMIHDAWSGTYGNPAELRDTADRLDKISNNIASIYADRAGGTTEEWRERMVEETWYSASEAVEAGLADSVVGADTEDKAEKLKNQLQLGAYAYAYTGRSAAPAPKITNTAPARRDITSHLDAALAVAEARNEETVSGPDSPVLAATKEGADMSDELTQGVAKRLGINLKGGEKITDEMILDALDEALEEQAGEESAAASTAGVVQAATPGTVVLDSAQHQALIADAAAGREARNQQIQDHRETVVSAAVNDGRIPPARKQHWLDLLEADPEAEKTLNSLAKGLVPLDEAGFTGGVDEANDEDRIYGNIYKKEA